MFENNFKFNRVLEKFREISLKNLTFLPELGFQLNKL